MKIFSGTANQKLGEKIARELKLPLSLPEKFVFPDGEERIRILERVVDEEIILVQPLSPPVNENLIELCFIVDALKRSGAKKVFAVISYLGYQRQDRVFRGGEAVSLMVIIKILESVGIDKILTFDLHSIKIPQFFKIPVVHLSALSLFAQKIKEIFETDYDLVLVSPDMGGVRRVKIFSRMLNDLSWAAIEKERDLATGAVKVEKINLGPGLRSLKNKTAVIIDDMVSGGGTGVKAAELLKKEGVEKIFVFVTHPVFSQNAPVLLQAAPIEKIYVTDTILISKDKQFPKLEILSVAEIITKEIKQA